MNNKPEFSIVIPCYNYGRFLRTAVDSILVQSLQNYEIIIVDDASTDDTSKIVRTYGDRVKYVHLNKNIGPGAAWVEGLKQVNGKYICKLDADDWLLDDFLKNAKKYFESDPNIGVVIASVYEYPDGGEYAKLYSVTASDTILTAEEFRSQLLQKFFMRMPGIVLRKEAIEATGLPVPELYMAHDWEYFLRISKNWKSFLLKKPGAVYRLHSKSITTAAGRNNRILEDFKFWMEVLTKRADCYHINKKERKILSLSMAKTYLKIQIKPKDKIYFNYRCYSHIINAGKFIMRESPFVLPFLIWFILRGTAEFIILKIKHIIKSVSTPEGNEAFPIKHLLPDSGKIIGPL